MALTFRVAERGDLDLLVALVREYYDCDHFPFDEAGTRGALEALVGAPALGRVWVLAEDGDAIGYAVLTLGYSIEYHGRDAFVDELYVRAGRRGRGYGARALAFLESACRALGVRALHLEVERKNTGAQRAYRAAGFEDHDRYLMTKRIRP